MTMGGVGTGVLRPNPSPTTNPAVVRAETVVKKPPRELATFPACAGVGARCRAQPVRVHRSEDFRCTACCDEAAECRRRRRIERFRARGEQLERFVVVEVAEPAPITAADFGRVLRTGVRNPPTTHDRTFAIKN